MFLTSKIKRLEREKQSLSMQADLYRQSIKLEIMGLRQENDWFWNGLSMFLSATTRIISVLSKR